LGCPDQGLQNQSKKSERQTYCEETKQVVMNSRSDFIT
jgi:hypothetical protein